MSRGSYSGDTLNICVETSLTNIQMPSHEEVQTNYWRIEYFDLFCMDSQGIERSQFTNSRPISAYWSQSQSLLWFLHLPYNQTDIPILELEICQGQETLISGNVVWLIFVEVKSNEKPIRYTNVPWFWLLQPPHPIPMTPMTTTQEPPGEPMWSLRPLRRRPMLPCRSADGRCWWVNDVNHWLNWAQLLGGICICIVYTLSWEWSSKLIFFKR